jgi:hypothetical protein
MMKRFIKKPIVIISFLFFALLVSALQFTPPEIIYKIFIQPAVASNLTNLSGVTGKVGKEDINFGTGQNTDTYTVPTYSGGTITLTKLPSLFANAASIIKGKWYVAAMAGDHGNAALTGSLAWVINTLGANPATIDLPGNQTYSLTTNLAIPETIVMNFQRGAILGGTGNISGDGLKHIKAGAWQIFSTSGTITFPDGSDIKSSWFADFETAITKISTAKVCLVVTEADTISNDTAVNANTALKWTGPGKILTISATKILTINGKFESPGLYQIFLCQGTEGVLFGQGSAKKVYPQWWGAVADGATDDLLPTQEAVDSIHTYGGTVFFPRGVYYLSSTLVVKNSDTVRSAYGMSFIGEGFQSCLYMPSGSDNILDLQYYGSAVTNRPVAGFYIGHMSFYGGTTGKAIYAQRVIHSLFENIWIRTGGIGIHLYGAENNTFNAVQIGSSVPTVYRPGYATGKPSGGAVGGTNTYGVYLQRDSTAGLLAGTQIASENVFNGLSVENCTNDGIYLSETFANVFSGTSKGHTGYAIRAGGANNDEFNLFIEACTGDDTGYGAGGGTTALYISGSRKCIFRVYADSVKARLLGGSFNNVFLGCWLEDVVIEAASQPNSFIECNVDNSWTDVTGATGQNIVGLTTGGVATLMDVPGNSAWDYNRKQFKYYTGGYWHYYGRNFPSPQTANFTVEITDSNTSFINNTATGTIVGSLPDAVAGYGPYIFTVTEPSGEDMQVDPLGADIIEGGAAGYSLILDNRGDSATLKCYAAGIWSITAFYGTLTFAP